MNSCGAEPTYLHFPPAAPLSTIETTIPPPASELTLTWEEEGD